MDTLAQTEQLPLGVFLANQPHHVKEGCRQPGQGGQSRDTRCIAGCQRGAASQAHGHPDRAAAGEEQGGRLSLYPWSPVLSSCPRPPAPDPHSRFPALSSFPKSLAPNSCPWSQMILYKGGCDQVSAEVPTPLSWWVSLGKRMAGGETWEFKIHWESI